MKNCTRPFCPQTLWLIAAGWILVALFIGESELLRTLPRIAPQVIAIGLTAFVLGSYCRSQALRSWVDSLELRWLIAVHLTRFVGFYFLFLASRDELPADFAQLAGWGDVIAASGAALLMLVQVPRWALFAWNVFGLIDILMVLGHAGLIRFKDPESLSAFTSLPLSFLPTLIVPLILITHVLIFVRLLKTPAKQSIATGAPRLA